MTERGDPASEPGGGAADPTVERPPGRVVSDGGVTTGDVTAGTERAAETDPAEVTDTGMDGQPTVLHVDDEPQVGLLVSEFLERTDPDLTVLTETDAAAALERIGAGDVDCVVTDVDMPGMSGTDLVRAMATRHPGLPVVLFTSNSWQSVGDEVVATSVDEFVRKAGGHGQFEAVADAVLAALD